MYKNWIIMLMLGLMVVMAQCGETSKASGGGQLKGHNIVIQISDDNARTKKIALNNAANVLKEWPQANIEIVAYGPGIGIMFRGKKNKFRNRVKELSMNNIRFSACGNTMRHVAKKKGRMPKLLKGVKQVKAGVKRIVELQEKGYSYIRP
ncbi:MAG TPA: hypothetical protein ENI73_03290 [Spirochaetes bacterium]|nr:hypothetical protein [Spirochaetota bacterium]